MLELALTGVAHMETFFLVCFAFGALFTVVSVVLGTVSHAPGMDAGHVGHMAHAPHMADGAHAPPHIAPGHADGTVDAPVPHLPLGLDTLPLFNVSSALAFLTWFGAAGYLLLRFGQWGLLVALLAAVAAGVAAAVLIALFLRKVLEGSRALDPRDFRLIGTLARVTAGIPDHGVGEIVFVKAGRRRSEAARSATGAAVPRNTEVVIMEYARGVASVEPWNDLLAGRERPAALPAAAATAPDAAESARVAPAARAATPNQ
jgi:membrane protein implicated in regulation of membrane protease activity